MTRHSARAAVWVAAAACAAALAPAAHGARADAITCDLSAYRPLDGLTASAEAGGVTVAWKGTDGDDLRLRLAVEDGVPLIDNLSIAHDGGGWATRLAHATPAFSVVSGLRRVTNQQLDPLAGLGIPITKAVVDRVKWEAFWDAPLNVPGGDPAHNNCTPPLRGVLDQPGLPRSPSEIVRGDAAYHVRSCAVRTNGARIEVSFPGVDLGVFSGRLQWTIYRGTNLIQQEIVAKTDRPSVAYKYDAGLRGVRQTDASKIRWRGLTNEWGETRLGGPPDAGPVVVKSNNRIIVAENASGAVAAFPPPHTFFWARETSYNLGYTWYRRDADGTFAFGVRQPESEESAAVEGRGTEDRHQNFALRSARPGTWQRMPVYLYVSAGPAADAMQHAAAFTHDDHFKAIPGYQVMATHFHMGLVGQARRAGGPGARVPDLELLRAAGVRIVAPVEGGGGFVAGLSSSGDPAYGGDDPEWLQWTRGLGAAADDPTGARAVASGRRAVTRNPAGPRAAADPYRAEAAYYETARRQSSRDFVVLPNTEMMRGDVARALGGHTDVVFSHPVYWEQGRTPGQPLVEPNATYGKVYHVGSPADMMAMTHREHMLLYMPHPESKGSTGFPAAIKDTAHFRDANYRGIGFRWGMGLDGSEQRLCEYRCLPVWDDMNNWVADLPTPPKYIQAISELYQQSYGDDIYANNPVNYVRIPELPAPGDWTAIVDAMARGDYFVTSGEVLITGYAVGGTGTTRTISADVQWTFPLEFVEVVWGDGVHTGRQVISATGWPPFGHHHFEIPFDATGRKWVRFAAWDSAGDGAMVQPVKLAAAPGHR